MSYFLLPFSGVGLVFLPVSYFYQPTLSSTGVLLSLQEKEDTGKVSTHTDTHAHMLGTSVMSHVLMQQAILPRTSKQPHTHTVYCR